MKIYSKFMLVCLAAGVVLTTSNNNMVSVNVNAEGTTVVSVKDAVNKLINSKITRLKFLQKQGQSTLHMMFIILKMLFMITI